MRIITALPLALIPTTALAQQSPHPAELRIAWTKCLSPEEAARKTSQEHFFETVGPIFGTNEKHLYIIVSATVNSDATTSCTKWVYTFAYRGAKKEGGGL
jgi:hypothetical protein